MKGHGEKLTRLQEKAIAALLTTTSVAEAAKMIPVGEGTLWRWLRQEGRFQEAYATARKELVRHAIVQIQGRMTKAVDTLVEVMENQEAPASSRVSAARSLLDLGLRATEFEELESRISELERQLSNRTKRP
jgi:hypothetical protein